MLCSSFRKMKVFPGKYFSCLLLSWHAGGGMPAAAQPSIFFCFSSSFCIFCSCMCTFLKSCPAFNLQRTVKHGNPHSHLKTLQGGGWPEVNSYGGSGLSPATGTGGVVHPPALHGVVGWQLRCSPILFTTASTGVSVCYWQWTGLRALLYAPTREDWGSRRMSVACKAWLFPWKQNFVL